MGFKLLAMCGEAERESGAGEKWLRINGITATNAAGWFGVEPVATTVATGRMGNYPMVVNAQDCPSAYEMQSGEASSERHL
jgi:hypothetical protein